MTHVRKKPFSLDDSDLEACLSSRNLVLENPRHFCEKNYASVFADTQNWPRKKQYFL